MADEAADPAATTPPASAARIGHGWDRHRLEPLSPDGAGRPLVLGGVRLESTRGPVGRSDGDALLHAVTDALLGAIAAPDIGELFPDTDQANEARDSMEFLDEAARRVRDAGWRIANVDATVVLQAPKIREHKERMRRNVAERLGLDLGAVNVKGKTAERVDAAGEERAVEAHAVTLLLRDGKATA